MVEYKGLFIDTEFSSKRHLKECWRASIGREQSYSDHELGAVEQLMERLDGMEDYQELFEG